MAKGVLAVWNKLEDHIRGWLSHRPVLYAVIDGVGIVLFWRGVWLTADYVFETLFMCNPFACSTINQISIMWWDGPLSLFIGILILLSTGVFVSNFIGNEIIMSGLRGEKRLTEKTEQEERLEVGAIAEIREEIRQIAEQLDGLERSLAKTKK